MYQSLYLLPEVNVFSSNYLIIKALPDLCLWVGQRGVCPPVKMLVILNFIIVATFVLKKKMVHIEKNPLYLRALCLERGAQASWRLGPRDPTIVTSAFIYYSTDTNQSAFQT